MHRVFFKPLILFHRSKWVSPISLALLVLAGGLVGAGVALYQQQQAFEEQTRQATESIQKDLQESAREIELHFKALERYARSSEYNPDAFPALLAHTAETLPMVHHVGVLYHVENAQSLAALKARMHAQGFESFHLKQQLIKQVYLPETGKFEPYADLLKGQSAPAVLVTAMPYVPEAQAMLGEQMEWPAQTPLSRLVKVAHQPHFSVLYSAPLGRDEALNVHVLPDLLLQQVMLGSGEAAPAGRAELIYTPQKGRTLSVYQLGPLSGTETSPPLWTVQHQFGFDLLGLPFTVTMMHGFYWSAFSWDILLLFAGGGMIMGLVLWWMIRNGAAHYAMLSDAKKRLDQLMHKAHDALIVTDEQGRIIEWSDRAKTLFGLKKDEVEGKPFTSLIAHHNDLDFESLLKKTGEEASRPLKLGRKFGHGVWSRLTIAPLEVNDGKEYFIFAQDVTEQHRQAQKIRKLAYFDELTGLENRARFEKAVAQLLEQGLDQNAALLFLDLDGFKKINDTFGHETGDELLTYVASRLKNVIPKVDRYHHVARFGGDEFVLFLTYEHEQDLIERVQKILKSLSRPFELKKGIVNISASIGIARYPEDGRTLNELERHADAAMYAAKEKGKNGYAFYTPEMGQQAHEQLRLETDLKQALNTNGLYLVYQPKIDARTFSLKGFEALIRWEHPEQGFIPPDKFIPVAEETNLILEVDEWVIHHVLQQLAQWQDTPFARCPVAINLSSKKITQEGFFHRLADQLARLGLSPAHVELEITEHSLMSSAEKHINQIREAQALGFAFAVDDFGTGHSSLAYLKRLPIHTLKIDRSFVKELPDNEEDRAIAGTVISMARSLRLATVAEGVETEAQVHWLQQQQCDQFQGYYFARPLKVSELPAWYAEHRQRFNLPD